MSLSSWSPLYKLENLMPQALKLEHSIHICDVSAPCRWYLNKNIPGSWSTSDSVIHSDEQWWDPVLNRLEGKLDQAFMFCSLKWGCPLKLHVYHDTWYMHACIQTWITYICIHMYMHTHAHTNMYMLKHKEKITNYILSLLVLPLSLNDPLLRWDFVKIGICNVYLSYNMVYKGKVRLW